MSRPSKGARLYLRKRKGRKPVWIIRDEGNVQISTGTDSRKAADAALADYIAHRDRPSGPLDANELTVGQALTIYAEDYAHTTAAPERTGYAIMALDPFWGDMTVSKVKGATCRRYTAERGVSPSTVRRELGVLQAALNYCAKEGHLLSAPLVWRPEASPPKERWLTRLEAAYLLRGARALRIDGRHLTRFILVGLYTGTRKTAILQLRIDQPSTDGGWIDTANGVLYRQSANARRTKKRQPPARLSRRLLAHVKRWRDLGSSFVVEDNKGHRVGDIRKGWANACKIATSMARANGHDIDLTDCSPHVLRHTCATWLMQRGAEIWDASGFLGMSVETLQRTYGHHHPDHQSSAVDALESRGFSGAPQKSGNT